jgi:hypothetical protein
MSVLRIGCFQCLGRAVDGVSRNPLVLEVSITEGEAPALLFLLRSGDFTIAGRS